MSQSRHWSLLLVRAGICLSAALAASTVSAQARPDAGRVLEQVESPPDLPLPPAMELEVRERPAIPLTSEDTIFVTKLRITGASLFSTDELHAQIADGAGRELNLAQLNELANRISGFYRRRGYLITRAYVPAQQIEDGVVEIAVLEGRLAQVRVVNDAGLRGAALAPLAAIATDAPLTASALERGLLMAADAAGARVKGALTPGAVVGTSDLLVDVEPGRRVLGSLNVDSYGSRHTGAERLSGSLEFNNPLKLGDQLTMVGLLSLEDLRYGQLGYQLPVSRWGARTGVSYSWVTYALGEEFESLAAEGEAKVASWHLLQPLMRSRQFSVSAQLQYDHKRLEDRLGVFDSLSDKTLDNWTLGLSGHFTDQLARPASNGFSLAYTRGDLRLDPFNRALDATSARTHGSFGRWNLGYQRLQTLTRRLSVYLSYAGQFAQDNLDSAEKISLGGAYGVRAYPQGEAAADRAHLLTAEGRLELPVPAIGRWQLAAFIDHGHARLSARTWAPGQQPGANHRDLTGAGLGLNVTDTHGWSLRAHAAWRISEERAASGREDSPRLWVRAARHF